MLSDTLNWTVHSQEDYVVKLVELISSLGGNLGLWLGLSAFSIGQYLLQTGNTLIGLKIF